MNKIVIANIIAVVTKTTDNDPKATPTNRTTIRKIIVSIINASISRPKNLSLFLVVLILGAPNSLVNLDTSYLF